MRSKKRSVQENMLNKLCEISGVWFISNIASFLRREERLVKSHQTDRRLIKHLSVNRKIETYWIKLVFILFFLVFHVQPVGFCSTLYRRLEYDHILQASGQPTWRCIKTTDPRSLHVPPWRSTWSMRRIWRKRMPLKAQCRQSHHCWCRMLLLLTVVMMKSEHRHVTW